LERHYPALLGTGNRLIEIADNNATNWVQANNILQNPNALHYGTSWSTAGTMNGFYWYYLGVPIDSNEIITVGRYTNSGIYKYVAYYSTICGIFTDTVEITATQNVPVKLSLFKANKVEKDILLNWPTASEINNDHFSLERSLDGNSFESIAYIKGKGNSANISNYQYNDINASAIYQENPFIYYRLNQIDFDGSSELSIVVAVNLNEKRFTSIKVIPNPNEGNFTMEFFTSNDGIATIEIQNMLGN